MEGGMGGLLVVSETLSPKKGTITWNKYAYYTCTALAITHHFMQE